MSNEAQIRKSIPLATPDFDQIKSSLKEYLKGQDKFTDYDFEGSVMATILDLLSYNTHFQSFYLNMVGNEAFLSTAVKRDSVVARAKQIGYVPRTASCGSATLFIEMQNSVGLSFIDIPQGTIFNASTAGQTFVFRTMDARRVFRNSDGKYTISDLDIVEGKSFTHTFSINEDKIKSGVVIPNANADSTRLKVYVRDNTTSSNFEKYELFDDVTNQTQDSNVYYISEVEGGLLNVYFGDGVISKQLTLGGEVKVEYVVSSGPAANNIGAFTLVSPIPNSDFTTIEVVSPVTGGALPETIDSIKFRAPKSYESQNRAVTASDYVDILVDHYSNLQDVIAWGGETNTPPQYGKVFLAIKPVVGFFITQSEKEKIQNILKRYNVITVKPVVLDADYVFVTVSTTVDFDGTQTDKSDGDMIQAISDSIIAYNGSTLSKFDKDLRFSALSRQIDTTDAAIISNTTELKLSKRIYPKLNIAQDILISFNNEINQGSIKSSNFTFNGFSSCFFEESQSTNKLNISTYQGATKIIVAPNVADVDYVSGNIAITNIEIDMVPSQYIDELTGEPFIKMWAIPTGNDVLATQRQIVEIDETQVRVNRLI